jgi:hypothetical protein
MEPEGSLLVLGESLVTMIIGKPGRRERPLGRPKHTWVHNIKMDLGEIGWGGMDWIGLG